MSMYANGDEYVQVEIKDGFLNSLRFPRDLVEVAYKICASASVVVPVSLDC